MEVQYILLAVAVAVALWYFFVYRKSQNAAESVPNASADPVKEQYGEEQYGEEDYEEEAYEEEAYEEEDVDVKPKEKSK